MPILGLPIWIGAWEDHARSLERALGIGLGGSPSPVGAGGVLGSLEWTMGRKSSKAMSPLQSYIAKNGTVDTFPAALNAADPRPAEGDTQAAKKNYAERLSNAIAVLIANRLRGGPVGPYFTNVLPKESGEGQESRARTGKGVKRLDVNYSTPELGLGLGVSVKTINFRDPKTQRFTKNVVRVDNELRAEAMDYHVRQPYAVLIALVLLPIEATQDGKPGLKKSSSSSFAHAVNVLRHRSNRVSPSEDAQLFEGVWIGLYDWDGGERGRVSFFDATSRVPQFGPPPPDNVLTLDGLVRAIVRKYDDRNKVRNAWDTDEEDPPTVLELDEAGLPTDASEAEDGED